MKMKIAVAVAEERFVGSHIALETIIRFAGLLLRSSLLHGKTSVILKF